jgi:phycocyanobilin lyase alpha subunit
MLVFVDPSGLCTDYGKIMEDNIQAAEPLTIEEAIARLQQTTDVGQRYYAAWWLGKFRVKDEQAIAALVLALEDELDRSPDGGYPLRRNAAKALGKVGDLSVVPALVTCLDCSDYYVRESAAQALEGLGFPEAIPPLMNLLAGGVEAAVQVEGKPHLTQPYEAIIEALGTLQAQEAIPLIEPFLNHDVLKIHYAAARAMYQLTGKAVYGERLVIGLQNNQLALRRSALIDLGASGYVEGAAAIAAAYAENSIKLIALKALLEHQFQQDNEELTLSSVKIMELMDSLL